MSRRPDVGPGTLDFGRCLLGPELQKFLRVDPAPSRRAPQWRCGPVARPVLPTRPITLPLRHLLSGRDQTLLEVEVHRVQPLAVVQDERSPAKKCSSASTTRPALAARTGGPRRDREIYPGVRRARLAVDDALQAEAGATRRLLQRRAGTGRARTASASRSPTAGPDRLLPGDALQRSRIQLGERPRYGQALDGIAGIQDHGSLALACSRGRRSFIVPSTTTSRGPGGCSRSTPIQTSLAPPALGEPSGISRSPTRRRSGSRRSVPSIRRAVIPPCFTRSGVRRSVAAHPGRARGRPGGRSQRRTSAIAVVRARSIRAVAHRTGCGVAHPSGTVIPHAARSGRLPLPHALALAGVPWSYPTRWRIPCTRRRAIRPRRRRRGPGAAAVSAEMTTSPRQSGVSSDERPLGHGKARTSVGPTTPR